jgi:hypothetical protein
MTIQRFPLLATFVLGLAVSAGCKSDTVTKFCLGADGTSQDCALGCTIEENEKACAKWAEKTKEICGKVSKEECQEICVKDENPTACELVKNWKS